jgi:hypothetical protein
MQEEVLESYDLAQAMHSLRHLTNKKPPVESGKTGFEYQKAQLKYQIA